MKEPVLVIIAAWFWVCFFLLCFFIQTPEEDVSFYLNSSHNCTLTVSFSISHSSSLKCGKHLQHFPLNLSHEWWREFDLVLLRNICEIYDLFVLPFRSIKSLPLTSMQGNLCLWLEMQVLYQRQKLKITEHNECKDYVSDSIRLDKMLIGKLKININTKISNKIPS